MPSAQRAPLHGDLSAVFGQRDSVVTRNLLVVAGSALAGTIIGGVSVLAVIAAIGSPPSHDAPVGSMVFDGPHVVQAMPPVASTAESTPASTPAPAPAAANAPVAVPALAPDPSQPAATLQSQPAAPDEAKAMPPAQPSQTTAVETTETLPSAQQQRPQRPSAQAQRSQRESKKTFKQAPPNAVSERTRRRPQADEDVADSRQQNIRPLYGSTVTPDNDGGPQYDNRPYRSRQYDSWNNNFFGFRHDNDGGDSD